MPKVNYYLHGAKDLSEPYIRLAFNYPGGRLVFYPGEKVRAAHWNAESQRLRKNTPAAADINAGLDRLEAIVLEIFRRYRTEGRALPVAVFRDEVQAAWTGKIKPKEQAETLFQFWERLVEERRASPNFARATCNACSSALHKVQRFAAATKRRVDFDTIDLDFHGQLLAWLAKLGQSPNTMHKLIATIKVVMSEALDRNLHSNMAFRSAKFTVKRFDPEHVYLTESEIAAIAALELPAGKRLDKARDLFLIGCYTGLRFSDYSMLQPENLSTFDGVEMLTVQTRKTRRKTSIPVSREARALLDKNGGKPPATMSNQKLNAYLKEICRLAGIIEPVRVVSIRGGQRVETVSPKCELVSTHTARRSYGTNEYIRAVKEGRAWRPIMEILGQTKEATFFRYVKVSQEQTAALFAKERGD